MTDHNKLEQIMESIKDQTPSWAIGQTQYYWITDNTIKCCGDDASVFQCKTCEDIIECEFHNNINEPHCQETSV